MLSGPLLSIFLLGYFLPFTNKIVSILVNFMKNTLSKGVLRNVFRGLRFLFFLGGGGVPITWLGPENPIQAKDFPDPFQGR